MSITPQVICRTIKAPEQVASWQTQVDIWNKTYTGSPVPITFDTMSGSVNRTRMSVGLPSRVCEDWAGLLWGEESHVEGSDLITDILGSDFHPRLLSHIEGTMALGAGCFEVIADMAVSDGQITAVNSLYVDTCEAANLYPLRWERGMITECAIVSVSEPYVDVRIHRHNGEQGSVENLRYKSRGMGLTPEPLPEGMAEMFTYTGPPMFAVWHPAIRNHLWTKGPFGMSVLHRPLDTFDVLDSAFDNLNSDIVLGRKMIMMPDTLLRRDTDGNPIAPQQDRTQLFVAFPDKMGEGGVPFEFNPSLRVEENTNAIETALSMVGEMCGMGADRYRYRNATIATATQIISEASVTYRNRAKHLKNLITALESTADSIDWFGKTYMSVTPVPVEVVIDDSVVTDDTSEAAEGRARYAAGLLSLERYLTEYEHLSDEEAAIEAERIRAQAVGF